MPFVVRYGCRRRRNASYPPWVSLGLLGGRRSRRLSGRRCKPLSSHGLGYRLPHWPLTRGGRSHHTPSRCRRPASRRRADVRVVRRGAPDRSNAGRDPAPFGRRLSPDDATAAWLARSRHTPPFGPRGGGPASARPRPSYLIIRYACRYPYSVDRYSNTRIVILRAAKLFEYRTTRTDTPMREAVRTLPSRPRACRRPSAESRPRRRGVAG